MQDFLETYLTPILTFVGGGGAVYLINWRSIKKQAEAEAMKVVQDVYQQTIADLKADKEEMRKENNDMHIKINELQKEVYQNTKDINMLKNYKCIVMECKLRKR